VGQTPPAVGQTPPAVGQTLAIRSQWVRAFPPIRDEAADGWGTRFALGFVLSQVSKSRPGAPSHLRWGGRSLSLARVFVLSQVSIESWGTLLEFSA